jgi:ABC-2 type transport system ATP-binding protein
MRGVQGERAGDGSGGQGEEARGYFAPPGHDGCGRAGGHHASVPVGRLDLDPASGSDHGGMANQTQPLAVAVTGLRKSFGDKMVLDGIDLIIPAGSIFALLGPNGAGKTTTVQILSTLIPATAGQVRVGGHDVRTGADTVRAAIGVTGQFSAVDNLLTGRENMLLMADLCHLARSEGRRRAAQLLREFELTGVAGQPAATYSGGMRRRLDLAMTLMIRPRILFLDEPTTGLDPRARRRTWQIVRDLVASGVTIFLTTQYLEEADQLADRIAVLDRGHLVAEGSPEELKRLVPGSHIRLGFPGAAELDAAARALPDVSRDGESLSLRFPSDGSAKSLRAVLDQLDAHSIEVSALTVHTPDLDDVFLTLTGHPGTDR